jgi:hypothetical protein
MTERKRDADSLSVQENAKQYEDKPVDICLDITSQQIHGKKAISHQEPPSKFCDVMIYPKPVKSEKISGFDKDVAACSKLDSKAIS